MALAFISGGEPSNQKLTLISPQPNFGPASLPQTDSSQAVVWSDSQWMLLADATSLEEPAPPGTELDALPENSPPEEPAAAAQLAQVSPVPTITAPATPLVAAVTPTPVPPTPIPPTATPTRPPPTATATSPATTITALGTQVSGSATHYGASFNGSPMGCGGVYSSSDATIIAVSPARYAEWPCGTSLQVCGAAGCIVGLRKDACPGCGPNQIDLSEAGLAQVCGPAASSCSVTIKPLR